MAPKYTLVYFDIRARGEPIRWILHYKKIPFEDKRVSFNDWPALKSSTAWGGLPVLEEDGKKLSQSGSILRYLGVRYYLNGSNPWENAVCDEYVEAVEDILPHFGKMMFEQDPVKKEEALKKLQDTIIPQIWGKFEIILKESGSGWLIGDKLTVADFKLAAFVDWLSDRLKMGEKMKAYPQVVKHSQKVMDLPGIKEYLKTRPPPAF